MCRQRELPRRGGRRRSPSYGFRHGRSVVVRGRLGRAVRNVADLGAFSEGPCAWRTGGNCWEVHARNPPGRGCVPANARERSRMAGRSALSGSRAGRREPALRPPWGLLPRRARAQSVHRQSNGLDPRLLSRHLTAAPGSIDRGRHRPAVSRVPAPVGALYLPHLVNVPPVRGRSTWGRRSAPCRFPCHG